MILTSAIDDVYDDLKKFDGLIVTRVGKRDDKIIILASVLRDNTKDEKHRDDVRIRSGALVRTHRAELEEVAEYIDYDFWIANSNDQVIIAISNDDQQDPSTLFPILDNLDYVTTLTKWISKGEEELIIDQEDQTIVDYDVRAVAENETKSLDQPSSSNYISRIISDIERRESNSSDDDDNDSTVSMSTYANFTFGPQNEYTPSSHDTSMDITNGRQFQTGQLATVLIGVATASLLAISFIRMTDIVIIGQLSYYILVISSSALLIGSMIYQDFVKE